jgi:hypothetical protein
MEIVIESVVENFKVKRKGSIEEVVPSETLIGSNTSAIPPTELRRGARRPQRILGIHWGEPANLTRFMEIICGKNTLPGHAERAVGLASHWCKEPSLLRTLNELAAGLNRGSQQDPALNFRSVIFSLNRRGIKAYLLKDPDHAAAEP